MFPLILSQYGGALLSGLLVTIGLFVAAASVAIAVGSFIGLVAARRQWTFTAMWAAHVILSSVPLLVALYWAHFPLQSALGVIWNPFWVAAGVLAVITAASIGHSVAHAIRHLPPYVTRLARTLSLSRGTTDRMIVGPIVFARVLPEVLGACMWILHGTLFASLISVEELFRVAQQVNSIVYSPITVYTIVAVVFLIPSIPLFLGADLLKRRLVSRGLMY